jgi:hypothetical protein
LELLLTQRFAEEFCQAGAIQHVIGQGDHGFLRSGLRQTTGIDAVDFQKIERRLNTRTLVSVWIFRLDMLDSRRCDMRKRPRSRIGRRCRRSTHSGLGDHRINDSFIAQTLNSAKIIDLIAMDFLNLLPREKTGSCAKGFPGRNN